MPGIYAHYAFGLRALEASGNRGEQVLSTQEDAFLLGCQGPDFCYYHMMRPGADIKHWRRLAHSLHTQKIGQMMREALVLTAKAKENAVRAYFLGYLTHYALDAYAHPYVFHHCYEKKYHLQFESAMDACLMRRDGFDPARKPLVMILGAVDEAQRKAIAAYWHVLLKNVYNIHVSERELSQAVTEIRRAFRIAASRYGLKKRVLETIAARLGVKDDLRALFYPDVHTMIEEDYLNEKRHAWSLPWDGSQTTDKSYPMIEQEACAFAAACLEAVVLYWEKKNTLSQALGCIGQMSMLTGKDWHVEYDTAANVSRRFFPKGRPDEGRGGDHRRWSQ